MALEPAQGVTKDRDPDLLFTHGKDYWFRAIWVDLRESGGASFSTANQAATVHPLDW